MRASARQGEGERRKQSTEAESQNINEIPEPEHHAQLAAATARNLVRQETACPIFFFPGLFLGND